MSGHGSILGPSRFKTDGQKSDVTGLAMRLVAVILPDLGTGPDTPIVISYWFAARGKPSGRGIGWSKYWSVQQLSMFPRRRPDALSRFARGKTT